MALVHILAVGWDPMVLSSRCSILRHAGYIVESASSSDEVNERLSGADFDLMLLCHSIPVQDRDRLIRTVRSKNSRIPIYLVASAWNEYEAGLVDGILSSRPEELLKATQLQTRESAIAKQHQPDELED